MYTSLEVYQASAEVILPFGIPNVSPYVVPGDHVPIDVRSLEVGSFYGTWHVGTGTDSDRRVRLNGTPYAMCMDGRKNTWLPLTHSLDGSAAMNFSALDSRLERVDHRWQDWDASRWIWCSMGEEFWIVSMP
jgi:hypothetical protein